MKNKMATETKWYLNAPSFFKKVKNAKISTNSFKPPKWVKLGKNKMAAEKKWRLYAQPFFKKDKNAKTLMNPFFSDSKHPLNNLNR